jgi:5-aminolevulinate synthase
LDDFGIYIQPIFYPTVPKGEERLRVTITPKHNKVDIDNFIECIDKAWSILEFKRENKDSIHSLA